MGGITSLPGSVHKKVRAAAIDRLRERRHADTFRCVQAGDRFTIAAYFAGEPRSIYQLRQWLWPLERLAESLAVEGSTKEPVAIFCRSISNALALTEMTDLPIRFGRLSRDMDEFFAVNPLRVVYYVNQNNQNFHSMRYPGPAHVHLSHGESEKISMVSNQLKAYDEVFVAGDAARERIQRALINVPAEKLHPVGRPQLDEPISAPAGWKPDSRRRTVLYAPTWEGDSPAMSYSSVARAGEAIVASLMDADWQVIYRPHPHTGTKDPETKAAHARIIKLIAGGGDHKTPGGGGEGAIHHVDIGSKYGWQQEAADACIGDMSAIAFDWLASGKPLIMMEANEGAEIDPQGIIACVPPVPQGQAGNIAGVLDAAFDAEYLGVLAGLASHYLGDTTPGAQIGRFIAESKWLIVGRWEELNRRAWPLS